MHLSLRIRDHRPDNAGHTFGQLDVSHFVLLWISISDSGAFALSERAALRH
jgi:hypothetical protein